MTSECFDETTNRRAGCARIVAWIGLFLLVGALLPANSGNAETPPANKNKFLPDDPLWEDADEKLLIPKPVARELSKSLDLFQKTFTHPPEGQREARNINSLGEVPDSSWFTNRMGRRVMSIEELVRGPNQGEGPDISEPWLILGAKTVGITPGFRIRDARGDTYFIKLDPLNWPQMATSTEVIGTKFFHAFGYNVPENYLVHWFPEYELDRGADVSWESGHVDRLNEAYVKHVLRAVPVWPDRTIQVLASKLLPGSWAGPFDYQGVRVDDPNDIFPHQDRRELRGLFVFCAWLNHNDSDAVNTLDMFVDRGDGRGYLKHYLIDFGTIMGSGASQPHARRVGNEYYIELKPAMKAAATLGIWDRPWRDVEYRVYPAVGRFESTYFEPSKWKPDYPNPAFDKMTPQDGLWATRTVMRFSDEMIRAIVATGEIDDPEAEEHVVATLIERRDKIVRHYLSLLNPIDLFAVVRGPGGEASLSFVNLGIEAGLAEECQYEYRWHTFSNETGVHRPIGRPELSPRSQLRIPDDAAEFLMVKLSTRCADRPKWRSEVDVYLRNRSFPSLVGIERHDPE
jgi:hypothetical protein